MPQGALDLVLYPVHALPATLRALEVDIAQGKLPMTAILFSKLFGVGEHIGFLNFARSHSPAPKRRGDYSASPSGRHRDHPRSPRGSPRERNGGHSRRSYSPRYDSAAEQNPNSDGYEENI